MNLLKKLFKSHRQLHSRTICKVPRNFGDEEQCATSQTKFSASLLNRVKRSFDAKRRRAERRIQNRRERRCLYREWKSAVLQQGPHPQHPSKCKIKDHSLSTLHAQQQHHPQTGRSRAPYMSSFPTASYDHVKSNHIATYSNPQHSQSRDPVSYTHLTLPTKRIV